jgi:hypothetical protein
VNVLSVSFLCRCFSFRYCLFVGAGFSFIYFRDYQYAGIFSALLLHFLVSSIFYILFKLLCYSVAFPLSSEIRTLDSFSMLCWVLAHLLTWHYYRYSVERAFLAGTIAGGLITFYRTAKFDPAVNSAFVPFRDQGGDAHNWFKRRGFLRAHLKFRARGASSSPLPLASSDHSSDPDSDLYIVNTHPNALPVGLSSRNRVNQFQQIVKECCCDGDHYRNTTVPATPLGSLAAAGMSVFVAGDFNIGQT